MAALSCANGKLLSRAWKLPFVSKNVLFLGGSDIIHRPPWQVSFYTESKLVENNTKRTKKKRDRFTVLKALASTVKPSPHRPSDYRYIPDMVLNPRLARTKKEVDLAMESGAKAADYILETFPHLFPLRKPVPEWPGEKVLLPATEVSIDDFRRLIKSGKNIQNIPKCVELYKILSTENDLSLEVHNDMLDFVGFHAVGCDGAKSTTVDGISTWGEKMFADKLFSELKDKGNGRTYEVYILGLLKHGEIIKALKVYQELTEKNLPGSLYMYNTLLSNVVNIAESDAERWTLVQDIVGAMQENNIKPNVVTFNELMAIAATMREGAGTLCIQLLREMKKLKIAPSLGSYHYLLLADRKEQLLQENLLRAILVDLKKGTVKYVIQHPSDPRFFSSAMDLARYTRKPDLAREIFNIVKDNEIENLIGQSRHSFFGNYLCAIARHSTVDELMTEYNNIVPAIFTPSDWVYEQIFISFHFNNDLTHLPSLYTDTLSLKIAATPKRIYAMFYALSRNIPKERAEEFLAVVIDVEYWMEVFSIAKTSETQSAVIRVLSLCNRYDEMMERLVECNKLDIIPSHAAMYAILESTVNHGHKKDALRTLKTMANYKIKLDSNTEQLIFNNDFLSSEKDVIISWFV